MAKCSLNDREQGVADILRVFDLDTGKELWQFKTDAPGRVNFPRLTPPRHRLPTPTSIPPAH